MTGGNYKGYFNETFKTKCLIIQDETLAAHREVGSSSEK